MKAKFYKGPYHGKSAEVNIRTFNDPVIVTTTPKYSDLLSPYPYATVSVEQHYYRVRMMKVWDEAGNRYMGPAMHPDGSLFLVYEGKH